MATAENFAELQRDQEEVAGLIQRFWINLCKLGKEKLTPALLEQRKTLLDRYWNSFFDGHRRIMRCKEAAASSYVKNEIFSETEEAYLDAATLIQQTLDDRLSVHPRSQGHEASSPQLAPQLPKIELPTFSGDPLQWESFRDLFRSLVHDVPQLPDVKKLLYLKTCLTGEAAQVIQNTPITEAGYRGAWEDLEFRYGNTRLISFAHHRALLTCQPARHESAAELKRLLDIFRQAIRAYSALNKPVKAWDEWFVYLLTQKLDNTTNLAWETSLANCRDVPSFHQLTLFLENRIQALDTASRREPVLRSSALKDVARVKIREGNSCKKNTTLVASSSKPKDSRKCPSCSGNHNLGYCANFKALTPLKRKERACFLRVCLNCLSTGHDMSKCCSKQVCLACSKPHHTLLHEVFAEESLSAISRSGPSNFTPIDNRQSATTLSLSSDHRTTVLLATARVRLEAPSGQAIEVRALLDTGSDASLVTEWVAQTLRLSRRAVNVAISGVQGHDSGTATSEVDLVLRPRCASNFRRPVRALVLKRLTSFVPAHQVPSASWPHIKDIALADPDFGTPARIDLILGADVCGTLLQGARRTGPSGTPVAQKTPLGWVLMGPTTTDSTAPESLVRSYHCLARDNVHQLLQRFWELEEIPEKAPLSPDEQQTEEHFRQTHERDNTGRYMVRLPFRQDPAIALGQSRSLALKLLLSCERRLASNPSLKQNYTTFMDEYMSLQHMEVIPEETDYDHAYYIPHHAVVKRHDPTAKLRVVFNASFPSSSGVSLNDCLLVGPKLQSDLWMVLTRWRLFRIVFTTDIVKMYRQIRVHPSDAHWQRILWRSHPEDSVQAFNLTTVTYGTASAPFLALRVMEQLADDEENRFPLGAQTLRKHRYVDDILAGADDENQAQELRRQLIAILQAGAFELSKWASNLPELQDSNAPEARLFHDSEGLNTLGIRWTPQDDTLALRVAGPVGSPRPYTKRTILADVASLFDPLGWAAPVLIFAKLLMQDLWMMGVGWDEDLPIEIQRTWLDFRHSLPQLDQLVVPRWTQYSSGDTLELHGFCDASQRAYAAAVYLRVSKRGISHTTLLIAKTKVAPVKTISIPRLELCGAALLAKLLLLIQQGLDVPVTVTAWTDSSVVLTWIRGHASLWKPFVAHRVSAIQTRIPAEQWRYINSAANPADLATRGITPAKLLTADLWWHGPSWLQGPPELWPSKFPPAAQSAETERRQASVNIVVKTSDDLLSRFSSLSRLLSVVAYCFRFAALTRRQSCPEGHIRASERAVALQALLRMSQMIHFQAELDQIQEKGELRRASALSSLRPFLDKQNLLRVGGRLDTSSLSYSEKHPVIIAGTCPLARLLVLDAHRQSLHGGPQLTTSLLVRKYWILRGRSLVRAVIRDCVQCRRFSGRPACQLMGQLPAERTLQQRAFQTSGVDYAGPIRLRTAPGRGHKSYKGYIALFVCLSTRAIHLEAVSDLTSASFIAAFRRFVSRRGRCATLLSDNGTVFRGADRELRAMFNQASDFYKDAGPLLAADGTDWKFIPPYAPHFGGLWEAGVKSVKHHLRRVIGDTTLTFEEISTVLCQIEACLNSRPLYALSTDPSDLAALTPGHFLIGEPLVAVPDPDPGTSNASLSTRWKLLNQMRASFWTRWRQEYLHHLQQLPKWRQLRENLEIGTLVLLLDELQPPTKWPMGRIEALHPGKDGKVRVVTVRTANGLLTRPIVKVCPLPVLSAVSTEKVASA